MLPSDLTLLTPFQRLIVEQAFVLAKELEDVADAIVPAAIRRDIELFYVKDDPEFDQVGNIAALLRFRTDQSKANRIAATS